MSSKDVIIADIIRVVEEQIKKNPSSHFYYYSIQDIKSFHGINCLLQLEFGFRLNPNKPNNCKILFKLVHPEMHDDCKQVDHLYSEIIGQYPNFNQENVSLALDKIKELISTLHFNVFRGDFYQSIPTIYTAVSDFFKDVEGLQFSGNDCCICMEVKVLTKTDCNHYLCIPCYQQIRLVPDEEYDEKRACPICREHISYTSA
jgi:hypothetical protein